jgi:hypothetical protein
MLLEKEGSQLLTEQTGHVLALGEGHELVLVRFGEHALECLPRAQQPPFAQCLALPAMQKSSAFHGVSPKAA